MTSRLFLVFFAVLAGVMAGLASSKRLSLRESYFDELLRIIERLISDISFSQQRLENIIVEYITTNPQMQKNLEEYREFLRGGQLNLSKGYLTKREHRLVGEFFMRLGSLDLQTQIDELTNQKQSFEHFKLEAKTKNKSFGGALVKLGFLSGLLVGILML